MKDCLRNMKCPSDMKLLRNEVKFARIRKAYFIATAASYAIRCISLAEGKFHEISPPACAGGLGGVMTIRPPG